MDDEDDQDHAGRPHDQGGRTALRDARRYWLVATGLGTAFAALLLLTAGDGAIERALDAAGIAFNTDLVTAGRLALAHPAAVGGIALSLAQVAAPDLAVLAVARRSGGQGSLRAVVARFRPWSAQVGARRGSLVWLQMTCLFVALSLATAALDTLWLRPGEHVWTAPRPSSALLGSLLVAMFLDAGALLEENGWRGYALPLLLQRFSPLGASVVLGLAWAAWHYPVKCNAFTDYGFGGFAYLGAFTLKIVLLTVVMTHFWRRAGQATLLAVAMHGLSNDSLRLQGELVGDSLRLSVVSELTIALPLAVAAAMLLLRTRGRLGA